MTEKERGKTLSKKIRATVPGRRTKHGLDYERWHLSVQVRYRDLLLANASVGSIFTLHLPGEKRQVKV